VVQDVQYVQVNWCKLVSMIWQQPILRLLHRQTDGTPQKLRKEPIQKSHGNVSQDIHGLRVSVHVLQGQVARFAVAARFLQVSMIWQQPILRLQHRQTDGTPQKSPLNQIKKCYGHVPVVTGIWQLLPTELEEDKGVRTALVNKCCQGLTI
jgi:hypothetical protein